MTILGRDSSSSLARAFRCAAARDTASQAMVLSSVVRRLPTFAGRTAWPSRARFASTSAPTAQHLIASLASANEAATAKEAPWFVANMPPAYFRQVEPGNQLRHLRAITALTSDGISAPEVLIRGDGAYTFLCATRRLERQRASARPPDIVTKVACCSARYL